VTESGADGALSYKLLSCLTNRYVENACIKSGFEVAVFNHKRLLSGLA